ncbi:MAG: MBL fold metallo-hydrolase [Gammaproteobacteria bacterium]|jgi:glyoxylase-like metal-dependent hydrolase (beta-lactamase superfamily II)|nr:MBL fold metallo-hydrolase [Gammaproteobacteria bacterium]
MMRVAGHWYDTRKLTNELTLIYEPHVHPFLRCNIWHLRGRDKDLLVDTGLGVSSLKNAIADMIDKPVMALATHIHYDHVGCLHEFDEGDVIDLGNKALTVYHLPGHSPGSIGLWDPAGSTLFSGDALYDGQLLDQLPGSNIPDYINTMKRLRELPVEAVHGGHEPSFDRKRMIELIDAYLDWRVSLTYGHFQQKLLIKCYKLLFK